MGDIVKVIYHIPILRKLCSAIEEADIMKKKIDYFVLNRDEFRELMKKENEEELYKDDSGKVYFYNIRVISEEEYENIEKGERYV